MYIVLRTRERTTKPLPQNGGRMLLPNPIQLLIDILSTEEIYMDAIEPQMIIRHRWFN